jgi:hypothetical protein
MSAVPRVSHSRSRAWIWVLFFTLAGIGLRFAGLGRLLPHLREPDTFIAFELQSIRGDPALIEETNFHERYPLLLARILSLLPYPEIPARPEAKDAEREHLAACAWPFLVTRALIASLACLLVPLTYFLARNFLSAGASVAAAFYIATSLLHILYSGEARPHGAHATLALAAVLAALWASRRPSLLRGAVAFIAAFAAVACLQTGLFVLPPLAVALFLADRGEPRWRGRWPALVLPIAAGVLAMVLFYPTLPYVDAQGFHTAAAEGGGHTVPFDYLNARGLWRSCSLLWIHDPILAILTASGIILGVSWWRRARQAIDSERRRALWIAASYALPYFLVISLNGDVYDRFLMPLLPYCACFAGGAAAWIVARVRASLVTPLARQLATGAVVFAAGAWPAYAALQFARVARAPDTLEQAAEFLRGHAQPAVDTILASPSVVVPLLYTPEAVREDLGDPTGHVIPWIMYQRLIPEQKDGVPRYSVRFVPGHLILKPHPDEIAVVSELLDDKRPDWVVLEISKKLKTFSTMRAFLEVVMQRGEIAFKSHGSAPAVLSLGGIDYQDADDDSLRIVETEAFGPPIVVFKMKH